MAISPSVRCTADAVVVLLPLVAPVRVVLANILSSVLLELLPAIGKALTTDGEAILSGILFEEREDLPSLDGITYGEVGAALGVAIFGTIFTNQLSVKLTDVFTTAGADPEQAGQATATLDPAFPLDVHALDHRTAATLGLGPDGAFLARPDAQVIAHWPTAPTDPPADLAEAVSGWLGRRPTANDQGRRMSYPPAGEWTVASRAEARVGAMGR